MDSSQEGSIASTQGRPAPKIILQPMTHPPSPLCTHLRSHYWAAEKTPLGGVKVRNSTLASATKHVALGTSLLSTGHMAGGVAQWLKALAAFTKYPGLVARAPAVAHNHL